MAVETAAAAELHQADGHILASVEDAVVGPHILKRSELGFIEWLQASRTCVCHHLRPGYFGIPHHDGIGEESSLFGHEGGMESSHHNLDAAFAVLVRDLVSATRGECLDRQRQKVRGFVVRDGMEAL